MDEKLNQLKDTYKQENSFNFSKTDAEQVYHKISDKKQSKTSVFNPFRLALTLAATLLVGFLLLANLDGLQQGENQTQPLPSFEGYVIEVLDGEALVTNSNTEKAVKFTNLPNDIKVGQKIKSWHSTQEDSNPSIAQFEEYEITNDNTVNGSNLTEAEAINVAIQNGILDANPSPIDSLLLVNNVEYNSDGQEWNIGIRFESGAIATIPVDDKTEAIANSFNYEFEYKEHGKQFKELEKQISDAQSDQGNILNRIAHANKEQGKELLNGAAIDNNGTVTIDFQPFEMSLATSEIGILSSELKDLAFAYDKVTEIYIQFNGNRETAYKHLGVEVSPLTRNIENRHPFEKLLNAYETTFRELAEGKYNPLDFETKEDVHDHFNRIMSDELASRHVTNFIVEREGEIHIRETHFPIFIDTEDEYEIKQVDPETYHVMQEHKSDLRGHINITFIIKQVDNGWLIDEVETAQIQN